MNAGVNLHERDLAKKPFTKPELLELLEGRDINKFINPKSTPYKQLNLADKQLSKDEWVDLLCREVNLFKRPFIIDGEKEIFGFSEAEYQKLIK